MKKILFVIPGCRTGGIVSSLIALLNSSFSKRYGVSIFVMGAYNTEIPDELGKYCIDGNKLLSMLYTNVETVTPFNIISLFPIKVITHLPKIGGLFSDKIEKKAISEIEGRNFDYIVAFQESLSLEFVSKIKCRNKIVWIHCDYSRIFRTKDIELQYFRKYSKIVTVSEYTKKVFCQLLPELSDRVVAVYNVMDYKQITQKSEASIDDVRFESSGFTIISVGRIVDVKQFELIPCIAAVLKSNGLSFKWYILGGANDVASFNKLNQQIGANHVDDIVICLGNKSNPYPYFKASDLLVSVSKSEACPMIFNEAKILGVPIVSNNFGSAYEFIENGKDGVICSVDEMPVVIGNIIENKGKYCPHISNDFDENIIQAKLDLLFQ